MHFTKQLVKRLQLKGIDMSYITLHIGLGTFRAVDVEDLTKHKMDSENYIVGTEVVNRVNTALDNKNKVCAVGTTAMRALESAVSANNRLKEREGWTDRFIFPPYEFKICSAMVTNFQQPESTLLMMAAAFGGFEQVMKAYEVAKKERSEEHTSELQSLRHLVCRLLLEKKKKKKKIQKMCKKYRKYI